jgi:NAD(P)H-dependent FMN reductase
MKIIAFAGSNSSHSINKKLVQYAVSLFENADMEVLDLNDYEMPIFSVDREAASGHPELAHEFLAKISTADLLVVSLAENNDSYSAAFKNIFDWCSRVRKDLFQDKPMLLMATSPGRRGGRNVLDTAERFFPDYGAQVQGVFSLPSFNYFFDVGRGVVSDAGKDAELRAIVKEIRQKASS